MQISTDFVVVGSGIAGASVAAELAANGHKVVLIERETHAGMHASGRSAAVFMASYGNEVVRALSAGSREFLTAQDHLWDGSLVHDRGALFIASPDQAGKLHAFLKDRLPLQPYLKLADSADARAMVPILREDQISECIYDFDALDVEVDALLQAYLRRLRAHGGELRTSSEFKGARRVGNGWIVRTSSGDIACGKVVNAAGAWADQVAQCCGVEPLGLQPHRRSAFLVAPPDGVAVEDWPLVFDVEEQFYFKPDAGLILISPANEDPSLPCDAAPEEIEVATGAYRVEQATTLSIRAVKSKWAGLRTFLPDRTPVVGETERQPGFVWCAGQGGYGVQMAPALARCTAAAAAGSDWPTDLTILGATADSLSPSRLSGSRNG